MNYRLMYLRIISHAKKEENLGLRKNGKFEKHHIMPKSIFPLWKNKQSNIVKLTLKEHRFCHDLLYKIYPCHEMLLAKTLMHTQDRSEIAKISNQSPIRKYKKYLKRMTKDEALSMFEGSQKETVIRFLKREEERLDNIARPKGNRGHTKGKHYMNISKANKQRWEKQENKDKVSKKLKEYYSNEENRKKLSKKLKGKNAKKIICIETGEIFESTVEASKKYKGHIIEAANGKRQKAAGMHWKYI